MLKKIEIIPLALKKMKQRKVAEEMVRDVLGTPGQTVDGYMGRKVGQKIFYDEKDERLLRVVYEETEEKFVGLESLGVTQGEFNNGRLNTPYGDFWFDLSRGDAKLGIMSHVDAPGYIAAFVMENSQGNVPGHMVEDLVRKLCKQAGDGKINQDLQKQVA